MTGLRTLQIPTSPMLRIAITLEGRFGLELVKQDKSFQANQPLSAYAVKAGAAPSTAGRRQGSQSED